MRPTRIFARCFVNLRMSFRVFLALAFAVVVLNSFAQRTQAIVNVTVINVTEKSPESKSQTVVIKGGMITQVGPSSKINVPEDADVIDGKGKFLIPGLWDMHVHLSYYGREALSLLIDNGVTSVRDMGGSLQQIDRWRDSIDAGLLKGPMIFRAGPFVDGPKEMDAQRASFTKVVRTSDDGRKVVHELKALGVDFIKIHSRVPREAFFAIASEAKRSDIPVMVHAPRDVSVAEISNAGARSIEHTESLLGSAIYEDDDRIRDSLTEAAFKRLETDPVFEIIKKNGNYYDPTAISIYLLNGTDYEKKLGPRLLPLVTKLYKAGVPLLTGSDFGVKEAGIKPGIDLHGELELFVRAGMTPIEALRAATINAAECMRFSAKLGSIEKGKGAHLVLLDADPLNDIRNTRKISKVFKGGEVFSPSH